VTCPTCGGKRFTPQRFTEVEGKDFLAGLRRCLDCCRARPQNQQVKPIPRERPRPIRPLFAYPVIFRVTFDVHARRDEERRSRGQR
jgi:hypothetical protein